jgi:hypothetical protein
MRRRKKQENKDWNQKEKCVFVFIRICVCL